MATMTLRAYIDSPIRTATVAALLACGGNDSSADSDTGSETGTATSSTTTESTGTDETTESGTGGPDGLRCRVPQAIAPGGGDPLFVLGSTLYYAASTVDINDDPDAYDLQLFRSDGTEAGTEAVIDINPAGDDLVGHLTVIDDTLYFRALNNAGLGSIWRSDGTADGTVELAAFATESPGRFTAMGSHVYFVVSDFEVDSKVLWRTDGTPAGTTAVSNPNPNGDSQLAINGVVGDRLILRADGGSTGAELWASDGTDAGTVFVEDIFPGPDGSMPIPIANVDAGLLLQARDDTNGAELWITDGTASGTSMVEDLHPDGSSGPRFVSELGDVVLFRAGEGEFNRELWRTDGTSAGTERVTSINPMGSAVIDTSNLVLDGVLLFGASDEGDSGDQLWRTDGTASGTSKVADPAGAGVDTGQSIWTLGVAAGHGYFAAEDGQVGVELWVSDGTPEGTELVADLDPSDSSAPSGFAELDGAIYFFAKPDGTSWLFRCELER